MRVCAKLSSGTRFRFLPPHPRALLLPTIPRTGPTFPTPPAHHLHSRTRIEKRILTFAFISHGFFVSTNWSAHKVEPLSERQKRIHITLEHPSPFDLVEQNETGSKVAVRVYTVK